MLWPSSPRRTRSTPALSSIYVRPSLRHLRSGHACLSFLRLRQPARRQRKHLCKAWHLDWSAYPCRLFHVCSGLGYCIPSSTIVCGLLLFRRITSTLLPPASGYSPSTRSCRLSAPGKQYETCVACAYVRHVPPAIVKYRAVSFHLSSDPVRN
ncbi:hypothetical protein BC628DRAFT_783730 [Trametes gibbosa]|nr:hypothetical protein BC628DRAFT_783730 [Trametes gibbosa]